MLNFLQNLGITSPGVGLVDNYGGMPAPVAANPVAPPIINAPAMPNVLQGMIAPPAPQMPPQVAQQAAPTGTRPARARSSVLDKIGQLADVFARVGGAPALYQPTLDARQDREISLGDHDRQVDMDGLKRTLAEQSITAGTGAIADANTARLQRAAQGLQAIQAANPNVDIATAWPLLAKSMGISDEQAGALAQAATQNPAIFQGLAEGGDNAKYGGSVVYGTDADGKLVAYQPGLGNRGGRNVLPEGVVPIDPLKFVNTGDAQVGVGTRSGRSTLILPNGEKPGAVADRNLKGKIAGDRNATAIRVANIGAGSRVTVAGMKPAGKGAPGKAAEGSGDTREALIALDNIQNGFNELHGMNALAGDHGGAVSNVLSALGRTGVGQAVGEQAGSPAAQTRLKLAKQVSSLQQTLIKALPASATRTKFEQEILMRSLPDPSKMSYETARSVIGEYKAAFQRAQQAAAAEIAGRGKPAGKPAPSRAPVKPRTNAGGWSLVGVK